jgi:hypothetical protein
MARLPRLMTVTAGVPAAPLGGGDRSRPKVTQFGDLMQNGPTFCFQLRKRIWHKVPPYASRIIYARFTPSQKPNASPPTIMSRTLFAGKALKREQNPDRLAGTDRELIAERRRLIRRSG